MYNVNIPVAQIRTRMRQEFERHRYANKLPIVDVLLFKSLADYQVRGASESLEPISRLPMNKDN
jgi:hypothetical protein